MTLAQLEEPNKLIGRLVGQEQKNGETKSRGSSPNQVDFINPPNLIFAPAPVSNAKSAAGVPANQEAQNVRNEGQAKTNEALPANSNQDVLAHLLETVTSLAGEVQASRRDKASLCAKLDALQQSQSAPQSVPTAHHGSPSPPSALQNGARSASQAASTPAAGAIPILDSTEQVLWQLAANLTRVQAAKALPEEGGACRTQLIGKDPSTGDKSAVFGCKIANGLCLSRTLAPPELSQEGAQHFCKGLSDVVAYLKGECTSESGEQENMLL